MVDLTLEIMLSPATHDLSYDPNKGAGRYRRGDVFEVHGSTDIAIIDGSGNYHLPSIGTTVFGYIHIKGVPNTRARQMRSVLTSTTGETRSEIKFDPETGLDVERDVPDAHRRRRWRIPRSVLGPGAIAALLADREITTTWTHAQPLIRRKIVNIRTDAQKDDESNAVTDADLS